MYVSFVLVSCLFFSRVVLCFVSCCITEDTDVNFTAIKKKKKKKKGNASKTTCTTQPEPPWEHASISPLNSSIDRPNTLFTVAELFLLRTAGSLCLKHCSISCFSPFVVDLRTARVLTLFGVWISFCISSANLDFVFCAKFRRSALNL